MKNELEHPASHGAMLGDFAQYWYGIEASEVQQEKLAGSAQTWRSLFEGSASETPFDSTPEDFRSALVAEADRQAARYLNGGAALQQHEAEPETCLQLSLTEVAARLQNGSLTSEEVTRQALTQLEKVHAATNACVAIEAESAMSQAKQCDALLKKTGKTAGVLHGVPLAHKDLLYRRDVAAWCGIKPREFLPHRPDISSVVLERIGAAGAVNLGRLHMTQYAFDPTGLNSELGPCRNPWDLSRLTGGSSSGSAVVVAARAVFGAVGTDTGGSVRIPAAVCGLTGLKPTWGLVSTRGAMPLSHTNDHIGPMARSAADCALMMQAMANVEVAGFSSAAALREGFAAVARGAVADLSGLRVGVPERFFYDGIEPEIARLMDASLALLREQGAVVKTLPDGEWDTLNALGAMITRVEASARIARLRQVTGLDEELLQRFEEGIAVPGALYVQALNERAARLRIFVHRVLQDVDVVHAPVCRIVTPLIAEAQASGPAAARIRAELTVLNRPFNYLGLPSLSLPCGFLPVEGGREIPTGFQLVGKPFADARLLAIGAAWQRDTSWHRRSPPAP